MLAAQHPYPQGTVMLALGTKRGLFLATSQDRAHWDVQATTLQGRRVYNAIVDQRGGCRLFAAENGDFFGSFVRYSDDFGQTWQEPKRGIQFPEDSHLKLQNIWVIEPGRPEEPDIVYVGVDPASLWVSADHGETWEPNHALLSHPTRDQWGPGAGGLCLHTIIADPTNPLRMWIGISAVGCLRTDDGGENWVFANKNTRASFLPELYPEFGQCIHRLVQHPTNPDVLYQQNHCGIYKSLNAGEEWQDIQQNLPSEFGFPMALDRQHPGTLYVIVEDPEGRHNIGSQLTVYRTTNDGENWEPLTKGLPSGAQVKLGVLRHGMCTDSKDPCGVYVGTNTGQLFASGDGGESWNLIADFLPPIYSVTATILGAD